MRPDYIPSHRHSAIIAPSYRPTPEYDAVMRQKRRMMPAHHDLHSQSLRSLNISNACAYRQPEALVYSQPEMRERGPYLGPNPGQYTPQVQVLFCIPVWIELHGVKYSDFCPCIIAHLIKCLGTCKQIIV